MTSWVGRGEFCLQDDRGSLQDLMEVRGWGLRLTFKIKDEHTWFGTLKIQRRTSALCPGTITTACGRWTPCLLLAAPWSRSRDWWMHDSHPDLCVICLQLCTLFSCSYTVPPHLGSHFLHLKSHTVICSLILLYGKIQKETALSWNSVTWASEQSGGISCCHTLSQRI